MARCWRRVGRWTLAAALAAAAMGVGAAEVHAITPSADLSISKDDGVTTAVAGLPVTYTIFVANAGPSDVGATVTDTFAATLTDVSWTCSTSGPTAVCPISGTGDINHPITLFAGTSVTYTVTATVAPGATGTLVNTATVDYVGDPNTANNSATDTDVITQEADLSVTKTDGVTEVTAGGTTTYTIVGSNAGPSAVLGANVVDTFPTGATVSWTCTPAGGGVCGNVNGSGALDELVDLPPGGSVTFTVAVSVPEDAASPFVNVVTIDGPEPVEDPVEGNNTATDADTLVIPPMTSSTTSTSTTVTSTTAPATTTATVAPTTSAAAVPPTPTTVAPIATASLPATGSSAAARVAPWGLALVVIGALGVGIAARRSPRRS